MSSFVVRRLFHINIVSSQEIPGQNWQIWYEAFVMQENM